MSWKRSTFPPSTYLPFSTTNTVSMADNGDLAFSVPIFDLLFKSTDNGVTWTKVEGNRPASARCMYTGNKLIAIANDGSTHVSEDGGALFTKSSDPTIVSSGLLCSSSKNLFTTRDKKIYRYGASSTGLREKTNNTLPLIIYPNPATTSLHLSLDNDKITAFKITNIYGQLLIDKTTNEEEDVTIDIETFKTGTYFIQIKTDQGTSTRKFIKQ